MPFFFSLRRMHALALVILVAALCTRSVSAVADTRPSYADQARREPLWLQQWHLHDQTERTDYWARAGVAPDHMGIIGAWRSFDVLGRNVVVAVVDDGLDHVHREFAECYNATLSHDYDGNDDDPSPRIHDSHGTEAAALVSGRANGVCGVGVAPASTLVGIRLIADPVSDDIEARGLTHRDDAVQVYSSSWGPSDDGMRLDGPGPITQSAMQDAVDNARNGLGTVYVWAAGNGRQFMDSCNYDGFANSRIVVQVCAVDYFGRDTPYGEWCSALLVCAPSSGARGPTDSQRIATAQPHGMFGESPGDCSTDFGGTSAAAPLVAGVVALMLEARPQLSWRDVQYVLAMSATRNDLSHHTWMQNGAGHWVSHAYGFGVVNATAAVELSLVWPLLDRDTYRYVSVHTDPETYIPLDEHALVAPTRVEFVIDDRETLEVEFVEFYLSVEHPRRGDIEALLFSPSGTRSELALPHGDNNPHFDRWRFGSRLSLGEAAAGTWVLTIRDALPNVLTGAFVEGELRIWGH